MLQRNESMLTFESAAVQGVGNIIEKLTVSISPSQSREGDGKADTRNRHRAFHSTKYSTELILPMRNRPVRRVEY
jgi:hypothetical protein